MNANPPDLPPLRDVIKRHGILANKALGQNFLFDTQLLSRIAAIPSNLAGEHVYEVGPGPGGLTRALLLAGAHVTAVERDIRCIPALNELQQYFPGQLDLHNGDAMKINPDDLISAPYHIVSNLPYNVGSALLIKWLSASPWPPRWKSLTLMFQREVADRITARPGTSAYGRLTVLAQWRSNAELAMKVHRSAFTPPPKIMSAVIHITPRQQPEGVTLPVLEKLTQAAFGQRRKMLRQSLKTISGALEVLEMLDIDPARRPETITIDEFVAIARALPS